MDLQDAELQIICSICSPSDLSNLRLKGLRTTDFNHHANLFDYVCEHTGKYDSIPSLEILEAEFQSVQFYEKINADDVDYLVDQVVTASMKRHAEAVLSRGIDLLNVEHPAKAIDYIGNHLFELKRSTKVSKSFTDRDALKRYDLYVQKRKAVLNGEVAGMATGLSVFDERNIGWNPGNVILLIGFKGVGKSFISLKTGIVAYVSGKKILYISPEMPVEDMEARWDVIVSRYYEYEFSNEAIVYGQRLNHKLYKEFLEKVTSRADWITCDSADGRAFDSDAIDALADEHNPDMIVVDGLYLIRGNKGAVGDWETMVTVANKLKTLATRKKCVILCTSQAKDGEIPSVEKIAYSKYLSQPMDFMLWLSFTPEAEEDKRILQVMSMRSGAKPKKPTTIAFCPDTGRIG